MTNRIYTGVEPPLAPDWLAQPLGGALLAAEHEQLGHALDGVFGEHLLQIGRWGPEEGCMPFARTQLATTVYRPGEGGMVSADYDRLPFDSDSVDAVVLQHTLDVTEHPHDVLREAHRVLRSEGRLLMVGFKPFGPWGARRLWSRRRFPPGVRNVLGDRVLRDWLRLLGMRTHEHQRFFFRLPVNRWGGSLSDEWESRGKRWWPEMAACYIIHARKRVAAMTPLRPSWRTRARVVGGVPEPSLRHVVVRIADDDDNRPEKDPKSR